MRAPRLGLRARFLAAGALLVLTTVAASAWTLVLLSRLAAVAAATVRDTDEATAAAAAVSSAIEREDDALLVILGGGSEGRPSLLAARAVTDEALARLHRDSTSGAHERISADLDAAVRAYRWTVDAIVAAPGEEPLDHYHREANPLLRAAVAATAAARDQRFEEARAATAAARDQVAQARGVVVVISALAVAIAAIVAFRLARHVLSDVNELARLDAMRMELVAVASHELRTPLTTLRMSLLLLGEGADHLTPRARDLLHTALGGVDQLGETVDELLDMARIEAGRLTLSPEPLDLGDLAREVADRSRPRADELAIRMELHVAPDLPSIPGDRARLRIVVDNVLSNALKYTPRGGSIDLRVSPRAAAGGRSVVEVAVIDSGVGIPAELRSRVFEKFFRVEHHRPGSEEAPRGTGIGLYLCKEIVELHGGSIRCEDAPGGRGTLVAFELPVSGPLGA